MQHCQYIQHVRATNELYIQLSETRFNSARAAKAAILMPASAVDDDASKRLRIFFVSTLGMFVTDWRPSAGS